ncbi:MAG: hypothetical protein LBJ48_06160 [Coriobacteriales bacterium]|jgi:hypothetical protein|nr:hypothetical protein [Coriobacteriales bacterium]
MGIVINTCKAGAEYARHAHAADNFATDASGRLVPHSNEYFDVMGLGSLDVIAYLDVAGIYRQNPHTMPGMRWEVGFSDGRVSFYSPDTNALFGGLAERPGRSTMGFYYYTELRSLSLASLKDPGGPYVSLVFAIWATAASPIHIGVRVHGAPASLHAFATLLVARCIEGFAALSPALVFDSSDAQRLFETVNGFDYATGIQTDLFLVARENRLSTIVYTP